jgi:hypothetical protein
MATQESALGGGRFHASGSTVTKNNTSTYSDSCVPSEDYSTVVGNGSWDNAHTSNLSNWGERLGGKPSILVQCAQCTGGSPNG